MRAYLALFCLILVDIAVSIPVLAYDPEPISWGALKATYGPGDLVSLRAIEKVVFPDPWPFPYHREPSISDHDAKTAMSKVGLMDLMTCSDVMVMGSTNGVSSGEIAVVSATLPSGSKSAWFVDLVEREVIQEYVFTSLDINSLQVQNVNTGEVVTATMIDDLATEDETQDHLEPYAVDLDPYGTDGFWDRIKAHWNGLNMCEKAHLVGGIVVCSATGTIGAGVFCGAAFYVSSAANC